MRVYTDKECYLAGEKLWVKVSSDDNALPGNTLSRVAYVEICDTAQVYAQGKVALNQGTGWACIHLPQTMHSGVYQLVAYTRYMRNLEPDSYPRKFVAVLNTLGSSEKDSRILNVLADQPEEGVVPVSSYMELKGDKEVYASREKVSLSWSPQLAGAKELVLSVFRKDCAVKLVQPEPEKPVWTKGERWLPECEGHIVTAKITEGELPETATTQLSCVGKEMKMFEGKKKTEGTYQFHTYGVNDRQDIVLSALNNEGKAYRLEIETPFVELLPQQVPTLYCQYEDSALISRSVALQLKNAMPKAVLPKGLEEMIYGQLPSKTYNLDEYVRFNIVKECIAEFVMGITISKEGERTVIKMLQENNKGYNMFPVLVLIDGVAFYDHSEVLDYNAHDVHYIHQYRGNYTLGETVYGGILSLITHRGTMPDMRIHNDMQMLSYEFPQDRPMFDMPDYDDEKRKMSRRPDFRHTMYWEPIVVGKTSTVFYTSDLEGVYVATLKGISAEGQKIEEKWEFEVK
jgi:hypothetical protein